MWKRLPLFVNDQPPTSMSITMWLWRVESVPARGIIWHECRATPASNLLFPSSGQSVKGWCIGRCYSLSTVSRMNSLIRIPRISIGRTSINKKFPYRNHHHLPQNSGRAIAERRKEAKAAPPPQPPNITSPISKEGEQIILHSTLPL
jgi:hypothetical protein